MSATRSEPVARRKYDSPVRREQAAATRERIVGAGAELLHGFPVWNWRALTVRGVAARAGVTERTVYRYFPTERDLRDAVLERLEQEAGVDLDGLTLDDLPMLTAQILEYVGSFPLGNRGPADPTLQAADQRQQDALLAAVRPATKGWTAKDRRIAAAMLDVLWNVGSYERLAGGWELAPEDAIAGVTWVMGLLTEAIYADRRPRA